MRTAGEAVQSAAGAAAIIASALDEMQKHKTFFAKRSVLLVEERATTIPITAAHRDSNHENAATASAAVVDNGASEKPSQRHVVLVPLHILRIQHATDVAVILAAVRTQNNNSNTATGTRVDRARVERDIAQGHSPWVPPPNRSRLQQWLLKRAMDLFFRRVTVEFFSAGPYRRASLCYFHVRTCPGVRGHVALTLDDAPGRFWGLLADDNSSNCSVLEEVRRLLKQYNAKATFMMVGSFLRASQQERNQNRHNNHAQQQQQQQQNQNEEEKALIRLLQDGHEFGNHGGTDHPHHRMASDADFVDAVNDCSHQIRLLQQKALQASTTTTTNNNDDDKTTTATTRTTAGSSSGVRYFRAPHGKYTRRMRDLLREQCHTNGSSSGGEGGPDTDAGLMNVMCDAYASDPVISDGAYIARSLTRQARHGGIILLHMPEALGYRDHCLVALRGLLDGLTRERQLRVVSVGMLEALARQ